MAQLVFILLCVIYFSVIIFLCSFLLGNITLMGLALGGLFWGGLGDRIGRRRSLLSAMAVHALFSGVATFMPTYGTFMCARFCSAIG